ncbi:MAG: acylphosphatase [Candidatus Aenigmarchaeota archaeon]|nr:acylphosphatase [Candidatus Aenigmarchaeota archaeon]
MPKVRIHAFISGRVQSINFRFNTRRVAQSLGLTG